MATPDTVQFAPVASEPSSLLLGLDKPLSNLDIEVEAVGRLGYETDDGSFGFVGHERDCGGFSDAAKQVAKWGDIAIQLLAPAYGGRFYMYMWRDPRDACVSLELQAGNLYFETERWPKVEWVRALLPAVCVSLGASASAYDAHRGELFEALDIAALLSGLRDGSLWATVPLSHYMVRHELMPAAEMRDLVRHHAPPGFRYSETTTGYYVLDNLF
ncbi:MAG TPA: hypothetical protein VK034_25805 [Enhygromyxa sp.]|nr:hypothetical protein [Enhygromyxa sp.]